jgi:hypothetical protein
MAMIRPALLLSLMMLASPVAAAEWQRYSNPEVGFSISLPTERFAVEKESPERLTLDEIGGSAQLDVFGVRNPERLTRRQFQAMMEAADPDRRITYRAAGRSWFVLSGYLEGEAEPTIFYAKFMLNPAGTALSAFEISYPKAQKRAFDATVERLEDSLTAPR